MSTGKCEICTVVQQKLASEEGRKTEYGVIRTLMLDMVQTHAKKTCLCHNFF